MNYDRASQDTLLGSVTIPLSLLKDQYPRENEYYLLGYDKNEIGKIFLSLQWLHSQEKYLSDTLAQWDEHIKQQEEDLYDYEKDLALLYSPFSHYVQLFRNDIKGANPAYGNQGATNIGYKIDEQPGLIIPQSPEYEKIDLRGVALQGFIDIDRNIFKPVMMLLGVFFVLTLLIHLYRASFIDLLICLTTVLFFELHIFDHQRAKFLLIAIGISCFIDFFWLFNYTSGWWSDVYDDQAKIVIEDASFKKFVVFMSYLSFFIKFPLAFAFMQLWKELEVQLQSKTVVKEKLLNTLNYNRSPEYAAAQIPYSQVYVPPQGSINRQYIVPAVSNQPAFGVPIQQSYIVTNPQQSVYGGNIQPNLAQTNIQQSVQVPYSNLKPTLY